MELSGRMSLRNQSTRPGPQCELCRLPYLCPEGRFRGGVVACVVVHECGECTADCSGEGSGQGRGADPVQFAEQRIRSLGVPATILRPAGFMEDFTSPPWSSRSPMRLLPVAPLAAVMPGVPALLAR
jgi:hypothetical protein